MNIFIALLLIVVFILLTAYFHKDSYLLIRRYRIKGFE